MSRVLAILVCCGAVDLDAAEKPKTIREANMPVASDLPIRVTLISATNSAFNLNKETTRVRQGSLQWSLLPTTGGRRFGKSIAIADVDGDGLLDVFVAQPRGATTRNPGSLSIFFGGKDGAFTGNPVVIEGAIPLDLFGTVVVNAGDLNGDGLSDVAIGAPNYSNGQFQEGAFLLIYGRRNAKPRRPDFRLETDHAGVQFALSVAPAGDVNGDGFGDLLVGAPRHAVKSYQEGIAYFYFGSATGLVARAVWTCYSHQRGAHGGEAIAAGDINRDGFSDVLVGLPDFDTSQSDAGRVLLFLGSKSGLKESPDWSMDGPHANARFGAELTVAGDLNEDGYSDVLIGAPGRGDEVKISGWVFAYSGNRDGLEKKPSWTVSDGQDGAAFGYSVASVGDINGDGHRDVLVGEPGFDGRYADQGRACLYLGSPNGLPTTPDWILEGGQPGAECGACVVPASDLNHDGLVDFAIGTRCYSTFGIKDGRVDIFLGSRTGYVKTNEFPADGTNAMSLPRESFNPVAFAQSFPTPPLLFAVIYVGGGGMVLAFGVGMILWRRKSRAALHRERHRLARDLHDEVGPHLARLSHLETSHEQASAENSAQSPATNVSQTARDMARALEQAVWAADPSHDTLESLVAFIGSQTEQIMAGTAIRCFFDLPENLPDFALSGEIRKGVVLTVREALGNAIKHSNASDICLRVKFGASELTVHIEDNGRGLPLETTRRFGNGLRNMRERMESIGGSCEIKNRETAGVRVTLRVSV